MSADRTERLAALLSQRPFEEDDEGVIANGDGASVEVMGRRELRLVAAGSVVALKAEPGRGENGRTEWGVRRPATWTEGAAAGAVLDDEEWAAALACLARAFAAVEETVFAFE